MNFEKIKINQLKYKIKKNRETPSLNKKKKKNSISQQKFSFPDILICDCAYCADKYSTIKSFYINRMKIMMFSLFHQSFLVLQKFYYSIQSHLRNSSVIVTNRCSDIVIHSILQRQRIVTQFGRAGRFVKENFYKFHFLIV